MTEQRNKSTGSRYTLVDRIFFFTEAMQNNSRGWIRIEEVDVLSGWSGG
jgi:hypothetical protein